MDEKLDRIHGMHKAIKEASVEQRICLMLALADTFEQDARRARNRSHGLRLKHLYEASQFMADAATKLHGAALTARSLAMRAKDVKHLTSMPVYVSRGEQARVKRKRGER